MAQRGRPKKPYPELTLHSELERLVAEDPIHYTWLGREWLAAYRLTFPNAYDRMREKFAGQKTWAAGTLARKKRNEVSGLPDEEVDLLNFVRLAGGRQRNHKGKRTPLRRHPCFGDGAFLDPDERRMNFRQFVLIDEEFDVA